MEKRALIVLLISAFMILGFAIPVVAAQPSPPSQPQPPSVFPCPICHENFSLHMEMLAHHYLAHFELQQGKTYCFICGTEFSNLSEAATHILTHTATDRPMYCPFCRYPVHENDSWSYAMYVHWTTVHDWWPSAFAPPQDMGWPGGMRPPSDWTPPTTWEVPENLLTDVVPPWMPDSSWKRPENWTPRSDWMPENSWKHSGMPPENMLPPENKPLWTWQSDNVTTGAPVGFSITEDSTPFIRSADNGPWVPAEITAENVAVGGLKINVSENVSDVIITTLSLEPEDLPENVPLPAENSCELFQVGTNIPTLIENAEIGIKVDQDWITANNLDDDSITLNHCVDGVWTELPTTITGEDGNYLYVSAQTPSFSVFAVTGETAAASEIPAETPTPGVPSAEIPITTIAAIGIGAIVVVFAIVLLMRRTK